MKQSIAGEAATLRIATYNIHGGKDAIKRPSLPQIAETLCEANADIVFLQECDQFLPRSGLKDQPAYLARALNMRHAFYGPLGVGAARFGNAVLTREKPLKIARLPIFASGGEPRGATGVQINIAGENGRNFDVWAFSVHLGLRDTWRETQLGALASHLNGLQNVLLGGDFNCRVDEPEMTRFLGQTGLAVVSLDAPTFPATVPAVRIDFLLARGTLFDVHAPPKNAGVPSSTVVGSSASDHCLVWRDLALNLGGAGDS